jgi:hypothetical protein
MRSEAFLLRGDEQAGDFAPAWLRCQSAIGPGGMSPFVEVFGCRPRTSGAAFADGRRTARSHDDCRRGGGSLTDDGARFSSRSRRRSQGRCREPVETVAPPAPVQA